MLTGAYAYVSGGDSVAGAYNGGSTAKTTAAYTVCFSAGDGIAISVAGLDAGSTESIASIAAWSTNETPTFALVFASPSFAVGDSGEMDSTNDWP